MAPPEDATDALELVTVKTGYTGLGDESWRREEIYDSIV